MGDGIDGGIRDTHQIPDKHFAVFFKYQSPNAGLGRHPAMA